MEKFSKGVPWIATKAFRIIESHLLNVKKDLKIRPLNAI